MGNARVAPASPEITANQVPSTISSIAAAAASRAALIFVRGDDIDPDVSTMITSAAAPDWPAVPAPLHVIDTIAWTSVASAARYSFSKTSVFHSAIRCSWLGWGSDRARDQGRGRRGGGRGRRS